jgi:hypothetical protein
MASQPQDKMNHLTHLKMFSAGDGEMAQQSGAPAALLRTWVQFLGYLMPCSGLRGHQAYKWCTHIHTGKRCIHIKILGNVFKLFSKLALHVCPVLCDTRAIYPQNFCVWTSAPVKLQLPILPDPSTPQPALYFLSLQTGLHQRPEAREVMKFSSTWDWLILIYVVFSRFLPYQGCVWFPCADRWLLVYEFTYKETVGALSYLTTHHAICVWCL